MSAIPAPDKRQRPTKMLSRYTVYGGKRTGGEPRTYIDRYSPRLLGLICAIATLSCMDAAFTLEFIRAGGSEWNPLLAIMLAVGPQTFIWSKIGLTSFGLVVLCLHKNFPGVRAILFAIFGLYIALLGYHLYIVHSFYQ